MRLDTIHQSDLDRHRRPFVLLRLHERTRDQRAHTTDNLYSEGTQRAGTSVYQSKIFRWTTGGVKDVLVGAAQEANCMSDTSAERMCLSSASANR